MQFFPRCQNDRTKFCIACFHGKKLPGSSTRRSFSAIRNVSPRNSSQRAFAGCEVFLDRGNLSACKEGFRDSRQPGAEALSRFRRIPPRNSIGIRAAARSHKERKVFALFICARQRVTGAAAHQILKFIAAGLSKGIRASVTVISPITGYRQRHIAVEGADPDVRWDAVLRGLLRPSQSSSGI